MGIIISCINLILVVGLALIYFDFSHLSMVTLARRMKRAKNGLEGKYGRIKIFGYREQLQSSREGPELIGQIIASYKLHQHNMVETINQAVADMEGAPRCRRLLLRLLPVLNQSQSQEKVAIAIKEFEEAIGTGWSNALGEIIYCSHTMGLDVEKALLDLQESIKRGKALEEYSQRKNNEARLMVKWLTPLSYIIMMLIGLVFFDMTAAEYMANQFYTGIGLWWFAIIAILYLFSIGIYGFFTNRKMDI